MNVLLLGTGRQGRAALYDLAHSEVVRRITAADQDLDGLLAFVQEKKLSGVTCERVSAGDPHDVRRLVRPGTDVVIDLLPVPFIGNAVRAAVDAGAHYVNTFYVTPEVRAVAGDAERKGVALLVEFGMDPGIDLVLLGHAVRSLDTVEDVVSYGAGFPEIEAADNAIRYKLTWTVEGLLKSYHRPGRVLRDGKIVAFDADAMFDDPLAHRLAIEGVGELEAFPNGDALRYADLLHLSIPPLRNMGRFVLRWPGHCAFWRTVTRLGLLDDEPVVLDGVAVDRRRFLACALEPHLRYRAQERDVVVVRVDVRGRRNGRDERVTLQIIDRRDLDTGFTAMSRTVGFTASIGAQMLGSGAIAKRGLLSPLTDVPYASFADALRSRGILVERNT